MAVNIDSVKKYIPEFSITNPAVSRVDAKDRVTPYTYIQWLENTKFDTKETLDYTEQYNRYLRGWSSIQKQTETETRSVITQRYKDLLKDITLNYTTAEEKRFLANVDYNNARHVESALPFYVSKIKQITLYVSRQRDIVKQQKTMSSHAGSIYGLSRQLSTQILNKALDPTLFNVDSVDSQSEPYFNVRIVELYDYSKGYFQQKNIPTTSLIFEEDKTIISQVLQDCQPVLALADNINLILAGSDVLLNNNVEAQSLEYGEFYNYKKSPANLNLLKRQQYFDDRSGSDTYQLTDGQLTLINSPAKPWRNMLNRGMVNVNDRHATDEQKSIDQVGGFFTPQHTGLLTFYSLKPELLITDNVSVDMLQDVNKHGNSVWSSTTGNPIDHNEDVTWVKADIANGALFGELVNTRDKAKFSGYTSAEETNRYPRYGLSRTTDSFGFFNGPKNQAWANEDVFPIDEQYVFDIDGRQERLLIGHRSVYQWRTDIFGNEYALYKQIQPERGPFDIGLDDIVNFEKAPTCEVLDGGDSLGKQKELDEEDTKTVIYDGGRAPGYDPKIEQYLIPMPFPDLRRVIDTDESGNLVFEDWNTHYYGQSPVDRRPTVAKNTPIAFHGFAPDVKYDRQAYCGFFTDDICGRLFPKIEECAIVDNYTFNVYTEETDDPNIYVSSDVSQGVEDAFDNYVHPNHEGYDIDVGFSNYGFSGDDIEFIEEGNIDGMLFSTEICDNLVGDFEYTEEQATYFDQPLEVGETKYSEDPEKSMERPKSLYEQATVTPGAAYFRSYNGAKIESLATALTNVLGNFDYLEDDDYDLFQKDVINDRIVSLDILYDVIVIRTINHILIEKIKFDPVSSTILPTGTSHIFMKLTGYDSPGVERGIPHFFNEVENILLFGKIKHATNSTGESYAYPEVYKVDLNTLKYKQTHPNKHYKHQLQDLFELPEDLSGWSVTSIDQPVMSYNDNTRVYNLSYSATLTSEGNSKYAIFSCDYRMGSYSMKLIDSYVYHSESLPTYVHPGEVWDDRIDDKTIKLYPDEDMMPHSQSIFGPRHTTRVDSLSSMSGFPLSGYKFDLTIDTKTIPVSYNLDDFKINRIIFDPGDGTTPYINDRIMDDGLQVLTFDLTELPDPSDFGDPRRLGFQHEYLFDKSEPHVYTATVSAIYSNFTTATYKIFIETLPYTVESGFDGAKLIDTKLFTDVEGRDRQLLVIETQNPRYVTNVMIDRNNGVSTTISGYVNGQRYTGPFHVMENGVYMTGETHHANSRMITGVPQINDSPPEPPRLIYTEITDDVDSNSPATPATPTETYNTSTSNTQNTSTSNTQNTSTSNTGNSSYTY